MKVSPLQKYEPKDWSGLTTENHLGALYATEPEVVDSMIEHIYKVNLGDDILSLLNQYKTHYISGNSETYEWWLQGQDEKNLPLIGAYTSITPTETAVTATSKCGIGFSRFWMEFPEALFSVTDVIVGEKPDLYSLRIVGKEAKGLNTLYEVEIITGDETKFVPYDELSANTRWSKDYSQVEQTLSSDGGDTHHTSPFKIQNVLSQIRKKYVVPGNMIVKGANKPLAFTWVDQKGVKQTRWISKLDYDFLTQFRREMAKLLIFGVSNKKKDGTYANIGTSGYEIRSGAGLREQISPSNIHEYNDFSIDHLTEIALGLSVGKLPEDSRRFVIGTGEYGMSIIDKAIEAKQISVVPDFVGDRVFGKGQDLGLGGQFKRFRTVNGIEFEVYKIGNYDDNVRNKIYHPDGGLAESRRMTIMDFGTSGGQNNIQKVAIKGQEEIFSYVQGMRSPFSPNNSPTAPGMAASSVDGYEVHRMYIGGLMVKNPMRMAELVPSILR